MESVAGESAAQPPARASTTQPTLADAIRMDDDGHVAALGEWCDCSRCLVSRESRMTELHASIVRPDGTVGAIDTASAAWWRNSAEPPRTVDRRKLVMWIGLGAFALGLAYLVGGRS